MAEAATVLGGAAFDGAIRVAEAPPMGMITLRADFAAKPVARAIKDATGIAVPKVRQIARDGARAMVWMAPDELLLLVPPKDVPKLRTDLPAKLADAPHLVADVSDARAVFLLDGAGWREVLAKGAPMDLSPGAFPPGEVRRTRLGQVAVAIWAEDDGTARLICFRSVAGFVFDWLKMAAARGSLPGLWT